MTRDEAIAKFTIESDLDDLAPAIVDGLEGLGLLKLDEPKSAREKFLDEMGKAGYWEGSNGMRDALMAFDASQK